MARRPSVWWLLASWAAVGVLADVPSSLAPLPQGSPGHLEPLASSALESKFVPPPVLGRTVHTTYSSPADQIKQAGVRALLGLLLVVFAFPLLWFNEKRQAKMWRLFGRAAAMARLGVAAERVDPQNEACLVHVVGETATEEVLRDAELGVSVAGCAKLARAVVMYQWVETSQEEPRDTAMGGKETVTTYSYSTDWAADAIDSNAFQERFGHDNPPMPFESKELQASAVALGAFRLPERLIAEMSNFQELSGNEILPSLAAKGRTLQLQAGGYTTVQPGMSPQVGDLRLTFQKVPCGAATVLAVQHNDSFAPLAYDMKVEGGRVVRPAGGDEPFLDEADKELQMENVAGCCALCTVLGWAVESRMEVFQIMESRTSLAGMLKAAQGEQQVLHLVLQVAGFLMLFVGLDFIFCFVPTFFRIIPFVGVWVQLFGNLLAHAAAFILASFLWCITVALAWFTMRPIKAAALLVAAGVLVALPTLMSGGS